MQRLSAITLAERDELWEILHSYEAALHELWKPDLINYAWLGNLVSAHGGHGHMHLIPRYITPRTIDATEFIDSEWGRHYDPKREWNPTLQGVCTSESLLLSLVQKTIAANLN